MVSLPLPACLSLPLGTLSVACCGLHLTHRKFGRRVCVSNAKIMFSFWRKINERPTRTLGTSEHFKCVETWQVIEVLYGERRFMFSLHLLLLPHLYVLCLHSDVFWTPVRLVYLYIWSDLLGCAKKKNRIKTQQLIATTNNNCDHDEEWNSETNTRSQQINKHSHKRTQFIRDK